MDLKLLGTLTSEVDASWKSDGMAHGSSVLATDSETLRLMADGAKASVRWRQANVAKPIDVMMHLIPDLVVGEMIWMCLITDHLEWKDDE